MTHGRALRGAVLLIPPRPPAFHPRHVVRKETGDAAALMCETSSCEQGRGTPEPRL